LGEAWTWVREVCLAGGLITALIATLVLMTGSWPPMVVIESGSMMHEEEGNVGAIDPGDLVLVMSNERTTVVSYAEAVQPGNPAEGHESHGMPGDVIIYRKNGGEMTPVIHRVLLRASAEQTATPDRAASDPCVGTGGSFDPVSTDADGKAGTCVLTWSVPGTLVYDVESINVEIDYACANGSNLQITNWDPGHAGYLTTGDNPATNGCNVDQYEAIGWTGGHFSARRGLTDEHGDPVTAVREDWIVGVAGAEIPWVGAVKLGLSDNSQFVPGPTWTKLAMTAIVLLAIPAIWERLANRAIETAPEVAQAEKEEAIVPTTEEE
jgi:signal peptidase